MGMRLMRLPMCLPDFLYHKPPTTLLPKLFAGSSQLETVGMGHFAHICTQLTQHTPYSQSSLSSASRSQIPCQFFAKGNCRKGKFCEFSHSVGESESNDAENEQSSPLEGVDTSNWTRELGGSLVTFQDGATVSKVTLPSDFSAVRLTDLPSNCSSEYLSEFISELAGVQITAKDVIRVGTLPNDTSGSTEIKKEDPLFARTICSALKSGGPHTAQAILITAPLPGGAPSLYRVDCRKVHCSWDRPTETAMLNYESYKVAQKLYDKFNSGIYRVRGHMVKAVEPVPEDGMGWMVTLTDLPEGTQEAHIFASIPDHNTPRQVQRGEPSYSVNSETAKVIVESALLKYGDLEWWAALDGARENRVKAQARFAEDSHARAAVAALNNTPLSFSPTTRLTVHLVTSVTFKVLNRVYDVVEKEIESQRLNWEDMHVRFIAHPSKNDSHYLLKLEGEDVVEVARAKGTLARIVAGELVQHRGNNLWHFAFRGNTNQEVRRIQGQIEQDCGVVIQRDKRKSQLRVFGPKRSSQEAVERLALLVNELKEAYPDNCQVIELTPELFYWARQGGLKGLRSILGENMVSFDTASSPPRLRITGSVEDYLKACSLVASRQFAPTKRDCAACWTTAVDPITTSCNHIYCLDCFNGLCNAAATGKFPITCHAIKSGSDRVFQKTITLAELQLLLTPTAFDDLIQASFTSHVRRNPETFRYCSKPDCENIYRVTPDDTATPINRTFTCHECLTGTCTRCHAAHAGKTCGDHKEEVSGGNMAFERFKRREGVRDCPRCGIAIQKREGCNHMECTGCQTHICWTCMASFADSDACYKHMRQAYGGYYDDSDEEDD